MLGVGDPKLMRSLRDQVAHIVQHPGEDPIPVGRSATPWTGPMRIVPVVFDDLRSGQVFDLLEGDIQHMFARP